MEDIEGRTFVEVMSEKYSPDNFPYRRGPGMGVVVVPMAGPQGSPMKGESEEQDSGPQELLWSCPCYEKTESFSDSSIHALLRPPQIV